MIMAVFLGSPPTPTHILVPPGVCGTWPLLAVWDPRFSWAHRQPTTPLVPPGVWGPAVFLGSPPTHNAYLVPPGVCGTWPLLAVWDPRQPTNIHLVPPGVCGSWPLLAVWDPQFSWHTANPQHPKFASTYRGSKQTLKYLTPKCQHKHIGMHTDKTQRLNPICQPNETTITEQVKETQTLDCAEPRTPKQQKNRNKPRVSCPAGRTRTTIPAAPHQNTPLIEQRAAPLHAGKPLRGFYHPALPVSASQALVELSTQSPPHHPQTARSILLVLRVHLPKTPRCRTTSLDFNLHFIGTDIIVAQRCHRHQPLGRGGCTLHVLSSNQWLHDTNVARKLFENTFALLSELTNTQQWFVN